LGGATGVETKILDIKKKREYLNEKFCFFKLLLDRHSIYMTV